MSEFITEQTEECTVVEVEGVDGSRLGKLDIRGDEEARVTIDSLTLNPNSIRVPDTLDGRLHALAINLRRLAMWADDAADLIERRIL